jgi:DNA-binding response OmpR family regulator
LEIQRSIDAGCNDHIIKPFTADELLRRIRALIQSVRVKWHHQQIIIRAMWHLSFCQTASGGFSVWIVRAMLRTFASGSLYGLVEVVDLSVLDSSVALGASSVPLTFTGKERQP